MRFVDGPAEGLEIDFVAWAPPRVYVRHLPFDPPDEAWWAVLTIEEAARLGAVTYELTDNGYRLAALQDTEHEWPPTEWKKGSRGRR